MPEGCSIVIVDGRTLWRRIILPRLIKQSNGCWEWSGTCRPYGGLWYRGRLVKIHRLVWAIKHKDPGKLWVLHKCDNPKCCRPSHLFLGTHQDNVDDKVKKNRQSRMFGLRNPSCTFSKSLTIDQAIEIRAKSRRGYTLERLASEYGVSTTPIRNIIGDKCHCYRIDNSTDSSLR
jgi:hypothetical protein